MRTVLELLTGELQKAFEACGYDKKYAKVVVSNRPDLCEYQCNGAMAATKEYKKAPFMIADEVAEKLAGNPYFEEITSVKPGFINIKIAQSFIANYIDEMAKDKKLGTKDGEKKTAVIDYGGANVAKPLHVGHLRPAVIGEALKRILRFNGYKVIGDVHLGDWGMPMGLIIEMLHDEQPDLPYFDESLTQEDFDKILEPPFNVSELERIYPAASARSKEDAEFKERAHQATLKLQSGYPAYRALWKMIMKVSVADLKKNYGNLNVNFDLWLGESDADPLIAPMIDDFIKRGFAHESEGALVVDVAKEDDTKEIPPCLIRKSDGAALYATSDLATIIQRMRDYNPDMIIYVVDKRQEMHFTQVFRTSRKTGIVNEDTVLSFQGFGTMNGPDNKPFKTRDGGVMRLEQLLNDINLAVYEKVKENRDTDDENAKKTAAIVGLAALKYGDLSNQITKDYIFDVSKFIAFEGNTGPYLLYTIVRIKSILAKYCEATGNNFGTAAFETIFNNINNGMLNADVSVKDNYTGVNKVQTPSEKNLMLELSKFGSVVNTACEELAPHKLCNYLYSLSDAFNSFYHENNIMGESDKERQKGLVSLISLTRKVLEIGIDMLGFEAPERM